MIITVTPADIATELGRPEPPSDSVQWRQWQSWIGRAYRAIERRARLVGVDPDELDFSTVEDVVIYAVAYRATRPSDGAESTTYQANVDDGSVSRTRRYGQGKGDLYFLDEWWDMLGLALPVHAGFSGSIPYQR